MIKRVVFEKVGNQRVACSVQTDGDQRKIVEKEENKSAPTKNRPQFEKKKKQIEQPV